MKIMAINLLLAIMLLPAASALDFDFSSPPNVQVNEEFAVSIDSFAPVERTYDSKLYVHNSSDPKISQKEIISQTLNGGAWKDSWYYLISAFPSQASYKIKVIEGSGSREICVQLRETGKTGFEKLCKQIFIAADSNEQGINNSSKGKEPQNITGTDSNIDSKQDFSTNKSINNSVITARVSEHLQNNLTYDNKKIILNPNAAKNLENIPAFITKEEKTRLYTIYGFTLFVIIVLILLAFKKL